MNSHDKNRVVYLPIDTPESIIKSYQDEDYDVRFSMDKTWKDSGYEIHHDEAYETTDEEIEKLINEVSKHYRY